MITIEKYKQMFGWSPDDRIVKDGVMLCPKCNKNIASGIDTYGLTPCDGCRSTVKIDGKYVSRIKGVYEDKKGNQYGVDQRGNKVDVPYEKWDRHGWKRAGKKTDGYDKSIIFR